jgi:hypothetical protein
LLLLLLLLAPFACSTAAPVCASVAGCLVFSVLSPLLLLPLLPVVLFAVVLFDPSIQGFSERRFDSCTMDSVLFSREDLQSHHTDDTVDLLRHNCHFILIPACIKDVHITSQVPMFHDIVTGVAHD